MKLSRMASIEAEPCMAIYQNGHEDEQDFGPIPAPQDHADGDQRRRARLLDEPSDYIDQPDRPAQSLAQVGCRALRALCNLRAGPMLNSERNLWAAS